MVETLTQTVTTSQVQVTDTQHSCTMTLTERFFFQYYQKSQNGVKMKFGNCTERCMGYFNAPKLWHQLVVTLL